MAALAAAMPSRAETIRAAGTGVGIAIVRQLAEQYRRDHPDTPIWVPESVGTGGAVKGLAAGKLDVGILARPLKSGEVEGGASVPICRTPLVFYINAGRRDVTLSRRDLPALFANALPPFPGGEVRVLLRPSTDTGFIRLLETYPDLVPAVTAARDARGAVMALTDQDAMEMVEASRTLLTFGAFAPLLAEKRKLIAVPLDGVAPSRETLESGHPFPEIPLVLALPPSATAQARAFVDYARSPAASALLRANGCIPVSGP
ncbi:PstS family phosphate ABC transporter substrate-binding protein [Magnetospirillum sp. ME-1]|uniref:PstS family phosphate ABC transporter substrate-binding protein n=1 Tax=Magnetospirillum sp. ME-1 TaxID=1639348 RepID=UPI0011AE1C37|nr:substrate-binding domain-containing protein [Magnetospirillum sp. ME-1]